MKNSPDLAYKVINGGITAAAGFSANGVAAGIKRSKETLDLGVVHSSVPAQAAGVFTTNAVRAACIRWNASHLPARNIQAICCNSGNANACTGARGEKDVEATAQSVADLLNIPGDSVLIASTGVIGEFLPLEKIRGALPQAVATLSPGNGRLFAQAIMTTDTREKEYSIAVSFSGGDAVIGGCAKGAGMIHPNMATMLGFITTDLSVPSRMLDSCLRKTIDMTFNNLSIDGDTSTNDMVLLLANGKSGVRIASADDRMIFERALFDVCNNLCAKIAEDGEGATKRIEINVTGGKTYRDCKRAAKAIANSNLVKTAIFGNDPNWGRILCAIGYSGARFSQKNLTVSLCGTQVFRDAGPVSFDKSGVLPALREKIVVIDVDLGHHGHTCAVAHTCDLSYDYIKINAEYHT
jgi:glutamate N-acetyltransferase/amino-acid N-acetyltransferase